MYISRSEQKRALVREKDREIDQNPSPLENAGGMFWEHPLGALPFGIT